MLNNINFENENLTDSEINKLLITARNHKNSKKRDDAKMELYKKCGQVFNNRPAKFRGLLKHKGIIKDWIYSDEDIYIECWIAFQASINNFGRQNKIMSRRAGEFDDHNIEYDYSTKNFLGYLKKVVDRHLYRVYEKRFRKGEVGSLYRDNGGYGEGYMAMRKLSSDSDPSDMMPTPEDYGLTEDETHLYLSRMDGITLSKYMKMYGVTQDLYYRTLESIKKKISNEMGYDY